MTGTDSILVNMNHGQDFVAGIRYSRVRHESAISKGFCPASRTERLPSSSLPEQ